LVKAELSESLVVGVGAFAGRHVADSALRATREFGLGNGLTGAAKGASTGSLLAETEAFLFSSFANVAESRRQHCLSVRRHIAREVSFGQARSKTARGSNALANQFAGEGRQGAAGCRDAARSLEAGQFIRRELCNALSGIRLEGLRSKGASAAQKVLPRTLNFSRDSRSGGGGARRLLGAEAKQLA
jgi:hypothetical protein